MKSIIPSVKYRKPKPIPDWLTGGLFGPVREPEAVRRQREMLRAMEAEAHALYRIEQKHPKKLGHDPPASEE